jgi:hypothetical protein
LLFLRILSLFFLLMFVLFRIIYRIEIIFNIISLQYFLLFKFGSHSFYCYFFYLRYFLIDFFFNFILPKFFFNFILPKFFFLQDLILILLITIFFQFCLNWFFFSILSFNIKLVKNWAFWLSSNLEFYKLRVLEINLSLQGHSGLLYFFSQLCLVFSPYF